MEIFYWPDGTWVSAAEYTDDAYLWKGGEYSSLTVDVDTPDAIIDACVRHAISQ